MYARIVCDKGSGKVKDLTTIFIYKEILCKQNPILGSLENWTGIREYNRISIEVMKYEKGWNNMEFDAISSRDLDNYILDSESVIIDLRTKRKYMKSHINNAINIPYEKLETVLDSLPRDKQIILYCDRGGTSLVAAKWLSEKGFKSKTVVGGFHSYRGPNKVYWVEAWDFLRKTVDSFQLHL